MSQVKIYHNPRCRKSRETLALIQDKGIDPEIIEYLKDVPTHKELADILIKLNKSPQDIIRRGEQVFKDKFARKDFTDDEWLQILVENPKLIERPIVVRGNAAVIGRPPENVLDLI